MNKNNIIKLSANEIARLLNVGVFNPVGILKDMFCWKIKGNSDVLLKSRRPVVSIVGTRDITSEQEHLIYNIVAQLKLNAASPIILSGLAIGTETAAHKAAIVYGMPTFAVLPCGIDTLYPQCNRRLSEKMIENGGGLISVFEDGTAPMAVNFMERNKVIAMISDLMIVPFTKTKGGAIVAAKFAAECETPVLAIPGGITDARSCGCNLLIKEGYAKILTEIEELRTMTITRN